MLTWWNLGSLVWGMDWLLFCVVEFGLIGTVDVGYFFGPHNPLSTSLGHISTASCIQLKTSRQCQRTQ